MRLNGLYPQSYNLDFNSDGTAEFVIYASGPLSTRGFTMWGLGQNRVWSYHPTESWFTVAMNAGETIGPSMTSPWYEWYQTEYFPSGEPRGSTFCSCVGEIGCLGFYAGLDSAYAGLEFQLDGQTHYGWLRLGAPIPELNGGWIYEYAYDTRPGATILPAILRAVCRCPARLGERPSAFSDAGSECAAMFKKSRGGRGAADEPAPVAMVALLRARLFTVKAQLPDSPPQTSI